MAKKKDVMKQKIEAAIRERVGNKPTISVKKNEAGVYACTVSGWPKAENSYAFNIGPGAIEQTNPEILVKYVLDAEQLASGEPGAAEAKK